MRVERTRSVERLTAKLRVIFGGARMAERQREEAGSEGKISGKAINAEKNYRHFVGEPIVIPACFLKRWGASF